MKINKILLIQPMHEKKGKTVRESINFPFGLAYIARVLTDGGYKIEVLDAQALQLEKQEVIDYLNSGSWDAVGITAFSTQYNAVKVFSDFLKKEKDILIIVGGPLPTFSWKLVLETTPVDFCVIGEGEITILDLLDNYDTPENVKGIAFRDKSGQIHQTSPREYIDTLDKLPRPAYELFDMERYIKVKMAIGINKQPQNTRVMTFITTRGCPYKCGFCSRTFSGFRSFSSEKTIKEISYLHEKYKLEGIAFNDELFVRNSVHIRKVAPELKKMQLFWGGQARVNLVDFDLLKFMKENGCIGVGYGIESGSHKILKRMNKGIKVSQIEKAMRYAMSLKLDIKVQLIFGYPGEDENTLRETIKLFKRIGHPGRRFNLIMPLPGSPLWEETLAEGLIKDEAAYLTELEKGFGKGKVLVNFTPWQDEEIYSKKYAVEQTIRRNYLKKHPVLTAKSIISKIVKEIKR